MLTCEHAQNLFDAYLDDELSSSMRMELNAHRLRCSSCQRQLTLLESCADVVARDATASMLSDDFTDRVMAALPMLTKTATAPRAARIYRLFAPVTAAAAAILMVIMIAPPIGNSGALDSETQMPEIVAVESTPTGGHSGTLSAVVVAGEKGFQTIASEDDGPVNLVTEYDAPLSEVMVDSGLTPTIRSWKQLRTDGTMLRDLGKMMLDRAVGDMVGEQVVPAGSTPADAAEDAPESDDADLLSGADEDQPL